MRSHIWSVTAGVLGRRKKQTALLALVLAGAVLAALLPPLVLEKMVDSLSAPGRAENADIGLLLAALLYLASFALAGVLESLQNALITRMGQAVTHALRSELCAKLQRLPAADFAESETGATASVFVNDVDAVDTLFTSGIISMAVDALKVLSILILVFFKSRGLGLLLCAVTPLLFAMTLVFQKRMRTAQMQNRVAVARVNQCVPETIRSIRTVQTYGCERFMEEKYNSAIEAGYAALDRSNFYDSVYSPIVVLSSALVIAVLMLGSALGPGLQSWFGVSVGGAVAIIAYVGRVFDPLESLGMEIQNIQSALAGVTRVDAFLDRPERPVRQSGSRAPARTPQPDAVPLIVFDHVRFAYGQERDIFSDLSFAVTRGENVVFTGRTGAGKSTLFKLLLGLYTPLQGCVLVGGVPAEELSDAERRRWFGCVEQHFAPVEGTLRDQITLFDASVSDVDVCQALALCGLLEKVKRLPGGLDTALEAVELSQGEIQLLSVARALAARPRILLLDEITANLDSATERRLLDVLAAASQGRTVLSISHRLAERLHSTRQIVVGTEDGLQSEKMG